MIPLKIFSYLCLCMDVDAWKDIHQILKLFLDGKILTDAIWRQHKNNFLSSFKYPEKYI